MTREDKRNAFLYCKFRDEQFSLYDEYAKRHGLSMKSLLVINALYYAKNGMTQTEICRRTFNSKQTVSLIIKNLLKDGQVVTEEIPSDKRNKLIRLTESGISAYRDVIVHITWAEDTAMSMFTAEEQNQLINLSRRFTQNLIDLVDNDPHHDERR